MQSTLEALAEPSRRRLLDELRKGERDVGELVALLGTSQPNVSKHLRTLRAAGLVEVTPQAQRRVYRVRAEPLRDLDDWLAPYRQAWNQRLDNLERHLDTMEDP